MDVGLGLVDLLVEAGISTAFGVHGGQTSPSTHPGCSSPQPEDSIRPAPRTHSELSSSSQLPSGSSTIAMVAHGRISQVSWHDDRAAGQLARRQDLGEVEDRDRPNTGNPLHP